MAGQRIIWLVAAIVVAVLCAAGAGSEIYRDYSTTRANIVSETTSTAKLADVHADRALSFIRDTFDRLSPFIASLDRHDQVAVADLRDRFQDMAIASESIGTIWVADADGNRWLNNTAIEAPVRAGLRDYFVAARDNPGAFHVGPVETGKFLARPRFTISRAVMDPQGRFAGVLTAGVDVDYFARIYGSVRSNPNVQIVALNLRGDVLATSSEGDPALAEIARQTLAGEDIARLDGGRWVAATARLSTVPVHLVAIANLDRALENWRRRSWQVATLSIAMMLGFALLTAAGIRSADREVRTADNLRLLNEHLEERVQERTASLDLLLRELNHRVKNNLQIIGSLIRLQARAQRDPAVTAILDKTNQRIFAVADLHCELETADSGCASSREFFERIVRRILEASEAPGKRVTLALNLDDVPLTVDRAVPLGLILNELVTNCFKHAFTDRIRGRIEVTFRVDAGLAELIVRDDGRGDAAAASSPGLGSRIVAMLARQINGVVKVDQRGGREIRIVAPLVGAAPAVTSLPRAAE